MNEGAYAWMNHRNYGFPVNLIKPQKAYLSAFHRRSMLTPAQLRSIARIAARIGQSDRSISTLQKLLSIPYEAPLAAIPPLTPALLRLDPNV